jgi:ribosomal protein S8
LTKEPGYIWSWLEKNDNIWTEIFNNKIIRKEVFLSSFEKQGAEIWQILIDRGWIESLDNDTARIIDVDKRTSPSLGQEIDKPVYEINKVLFTVVEGIVDFINSLANGEEIWQLLIDRDWLDKIKDTKSDILDAAIDKIVKYITSLENGEKIWQFLIDNGWIEKIYTTKISVLDAYKRVYAHLSNIKKEEIIEKINNILMGSYIGTVSARAKFCGKQEIKEGWLKLSPENN